MSSNIRVNRVCEYCKKEFMARTTITRYCSHKCNSAHYKQRKKASGKTSTTTSSVEELKTKEFLTVTQVSKLIGCSRQNIYKLIKNGKLKATNILEKKTIIKRSEIDKLFENPIEDVKEKDSVDDMLYFDIAECYMILEIQNKYGVSEKALYEIIKRNKIPRIKNGWYVFVPKKMIDEILS